MPRASLEQESGPSSGGQHAASEPRTTEAVKTEAAAPEGLEAAPLLPRSPSGFRKIPITLEEVRVRVRVRVRIRVRV